MQIFQSSYLTEVVIDTFLKVVTCHEDTKISCETTYTTFIKGREVMCLEQNSKNFKKYEFIIANHSC